MRVNGWYEDFNTGDAGSFHRRPMPSDPVPSVWWFDVDRPALVLGSSQPLADIDLDACRDADVEVVRRRSGGGSVLLLPGESIWVDILIPTTNRHWTNDVSASAWWLGDVWREALRHCGVDDPVVHRGPLVSTSWSRQVCFAGLGGGEVTIRPSGSQQGDGARKVVGISQRRTRSGARFQCALHLRWHPEAYAPLLNPPRPAVSDLQDVASGVDIEVGALRSALLHSLGQADAAPT